MFGVLARGSKKIVKFTYKNKKYILIIFIFIRLKPDILDKILIELGFKNKDLVLETEYGPIIIRGSSWLGRKASDLKNNKIVDRCLSLIPFISKFLSKKKKTDPSKAALDALNKNLKRSRDLF